MKFISMLAISKLLLGPIRIETLGPKHFPFASLFKFELAASHLEFYTSYTNW